ncbi:MAG TPA: PAS domain S-box protein, partial [Candidatus Binatia bacterium]|nr:PAS domain S-box protein [Candidatus Binatia bacterium]
AHELRDRLAALVESSDDAIISKTLDGIITTWNKGAERMFGYRPEEVIGKPVTILIPPDRVNEEPAILERLRRGERMDHYETIRRCKDGTLLNISLSVSPVRDASGAIIGASKIARDITDRLRGETALRQAQEELNRHAQDLERQVNERTADLRQTIGELEAFSYSISHDLRAPLRAMQSFALILGEECGPKIGPEGKDYIRRITTAAGRMDLLIRDVLTYSRVARDEIKLAPVPLESLLQEIIDSYPNLHANGARIELKGPFPTVLANKAVLTQCVSNLLANAVKFIAAGVTPKVEVWSELTDDGKAARLFIKDNGIGIEPNLQEKIFGIFERASTQYEGTGIGLAIVKKGMERIGGRVSLQSEPGRGSTFWLELPLAN